MHGLQSALKLRLQKLSRYKVEAGACSGCGHVNIAMETSDASSAGSGGESDGTEDEDDGENQATETGEKSSRESREGTPQVEDAENDEYDEQELADVGGSLSIGGAIGPRRILLALLGPNFFADAAEQKQSEIVATAATAAARRFTSWSRRLCWRHMRRLQRRNQIRRFAGFESGLLVDLLCVSAVADACGVLDRLLQINSAIEAEVDLEEVRQDAEADRVGGRIFHLCLRAAVDGADCWLTSWSMAIADELTARLTLPDGFGPLTIGTCDRVCLEPGRPLAATPCCRQRVCLACLAAHARSRLLEGRPQPPPCPLCPAEAVFSVDQLRFLLANCGSGCAHSRRQLLVLLERRLADQAVGLDSRTCPHCGLLTPRPPPSPSRQPNQAPIETEPQPASSEDADDGSSALACIVTCQRCFQAWCFDCHAPLHPDRSCANFRRSQDQLLAQWCNITYSENGQILRRAQRCPRCFVLIEKDSGCNHVICSRCGYEFCYACRAPHHAGDCVPLDLAEAAAQRSRNARLCRQFRFWEEFNRSVPLARPCPGPSCRYYVALPETLVRRAPYDWETRCDLCQILFCYLCGTRAHLGQHCPIVKRRLEEMTTEMVTDPVSGLQLARSRQCPRCPALVPLPLNLDLHHQQQLEHQQEQTRQQLQTTQHQLHRQQLQDEFCSRCLECSHVFCYRCGESWSPELNCYLLMSQQHVESIFGGHTDALSVFGCRYIYQSDRPVLRRVMRGLRLLAIIILLIVAVALLSPFIAAFLSIAVIVVVIAGLFVLAYKIFRRLGR